MQLIISILILFILINCIRDNGVKNPKTVAKYTLLTGFFAVVGLGITYLGLGYVGAVTSSMDVFENGGQLLSWLTNSMFGMTGNIILGIAVLLACLTTSIGLASSFADYFQTLLPKYSYHTILLAVCAFSFIISNVGLTLLIHYTLPALIMIYPPAIVLVVLSFFDKIIHGKSEAYALSMLLAFLVGILNGLESLNLSLGPVGDFASLIPWYELGVGWIVPAILGLLIGMIPSVNFLGGKRKTN